MDETTLSDVANCVENQVHKFPRAIYENNKEIIGYISMKINGERNTAHGNTIATKTCDVKMHVKLQITIEKVIDNFPKKES